MRHTAPPWGEQTKRFDTDSVGRRFFGDGDRPIVDAVRQVAQARDIPTAQVALAWVLKNPVVCAPIVGATKERHLTDEEIQTLEEPYTVRQPTSS